MVHRRAAFDSYQEQSNMPKRMIPKLNAMRSLKTSSWPLYFYHESLLLFSYTLCNTWSIDQLQSTTQLPQIPQLFA